MSHDHTAAEPVEVVAKSQRGMLDAVRRALAGAATTMGGLERCNATLQPQVVREGRSSQFEILISVTRR